MCGGAFTLRPHGVRQELRGDKQWGQGRLPGWGVRGWATIFGLRTLRSINILESEPGTHLVTKVHLST